MRGRGGGGGSLGTIYQGGGPPVQPGKGVGGVDVDGGEAAGPGPPRRPPAGSSFIAGRLGFISSSFTGTFEAPGRPEEDLGEEGL